MFTVKILNPHGLRVKAVWPTLKAVGLSFRDCESLLKGQALRLPLLAAGIVEGVINDLGHLVERKQTC